MPERHITDEEIHGASGQAPRHPVGVPKATCLNCEQEHTAWYATMAHECRFAITDGANKPRKAMYYEFLIELQRLGLGVVQTPDDLKFRPDKIITARVALTQHLQTNLHVGSRYTLDHDYYRRDEWLDLGIPFVHLPGERTHAG